MKNPNKSSKKNHNNRKDNLNYLNNNKNNDKKFTNSSKPINNGLKKKQQFQQQQKKTKGQRQKMNKNALRLLSGVQDINENGGQFPPLFNIAPRANIVVNATCGQNGIEEYCKLFEANKSHNKIDKLSWEIKCDKCYDLKTLNDKNERIIQNHSIENVKNNGNSMENGWWQSPTLLNGYEYEYVTITIDLKQVFQIFFIMMKAANSPRPASWILEKSFDNITYEPWQYFGLNDLDCKRRYNMSGQTGKYIFNTDKEIICTTQYAKDHPLENGEIHVSLLKNRPGAILQSSELLEFISTRYIRIRFQGMHSVANLDNSVLDSESLLKRSFYSLKQIRISGRLNCHGHANKTVELKAGEDEIDNDGNSILQCLCTHNTCGKDCSHCCSLYNAKPFKIGTFREDNTCERCECNGHAKDCKYDENFGAICLNCDNNTAGSQCETCKPGFYRMKASNLTTGCIPCKCNNIGANCDPNTGVCLCKEGFTGSHCEFCSTGYYGEYCLQCVCDKRGTIAGGECENHCQCKELVEGEICSQCLIGYFGLRTDNPKGCEKCWCSGVGLSCSSANITTSVKKTLYGWKVTDLSCSVFSNPILDADGKHLIFGMYDLPNVESVYWYAPEEYTGNHLTSYGSKIVLEISWVIIRGDTSGKPTSGPDIILMGKNGMKIAYGDADYQYSAAAIQIEFREKGWYHVPKSVKDIVTKMKRAEYHGGAVSRSQFMSVLANIEAILIRGTFHTDQVETILENVSLYSGNSKEEDEYEIESGIANQGLIENCVCPPGYRGLSCESCDFGYMKGYESSSPQDYIEKCIECPCNGHAETCNIINGTCGICHHNTYGEKCERCQVGFYGNPLKGTPNDCSRCACPLLENSNNFSPSCQLKTFSMDINQSRNVNENSELDYVCTQCPIGYTGDFCEMCDDGFYGNPTVLGSKCLPCECDGGPCDIFTGECIECRGNTEGWHCERCKYGYWGDPSQGCIACDCFKEGSTSEVCDTQTGNCLCKPQYSDQKCDSCEIGYSNFELKCQPCDCNINGSLGEACDIITGACKCKTGVGGLKCDVCEDKFFGLSEAGCEECLCNPVGSLTQICDRKTGQCLCHPNVTGKRCERCENGFWNLTTGIGCRDCSCNNIGSIDDECDLWTGQCNCKKGIGGRHCDQCLDGFYGFSNLGCKLCDVCQTPGHICDSETGRCVCPPNSKGYDCLQCHQGTWGWKSKIGCQKCNCDMSGSIGQTCETQTGQCICREGYTGRRCDVCRVGYFGYPNCRRCNCNPDGSLIRNDGIIECDQDGKCFCKEFVEGLKCDKCVKSTFGLTKTNPTGCTKCFCFGRSQFCRQSELSWGHIRMPISRNLSVHYVNPTSVPSRDYEYIVVVLLEGTHMFHEDAEIGQMNGLNLIPSSVGNVTIGAYTWFYLPLYFQLPPQFYGDRTSSYGGYLKFNITTEGATTPLERNILLEYPLVQIHSHGRLVLDYYSTKWTNTEKNETYVIPLHESYWKFHHNRQDITRAVMMTALQNIKHIFIRASSYADFLSVVLCDVHMDSAIYLAGSKNIIANGIELCSCSPQYGGYSCQDPGKGYYRWRNTTDSTEIFFLEDLIGWSIPCNCNGRSDECDQETGTCLKCKNFTGGDNCERCAEGYYGDPNYGQCEPCPCPETNRNFARGCNIFMGEVSCICKPGYTGARCDRCRSGYYGNPHELHGTCKPCDCNLNGVITDECDSTTGQCDCRFGVSGRQCDTCTSERHFLSENKECKTCDNCTLILLDYVESVSNKLRRGIAHMDLTGIPAPWLNLQEYDTQMQNIRSHLYNFSNAKHQIETFDVASLEKLLSHSENTKIRWRKFNVTAAKKSLAANQQRLDANQIYLEAIGVIRDDILRTIFELNNYGNHEQHISLPSALEQARHYLTEIKYHQDTTNTMREAWRCAWNDYYFYGNASDTVFDQKGMLEMFWRKINQFHHRMADLGRYTDKTFDMLNEADDIRSHVVNLQNYVYETYGQAKEMTDYIQQLLDSDLMPRANVMIDMVDGGGEQIDVNIKNMENLRGMWNESWINENNLRRDLRKHWLPKAWRHAKRLMERSNDYAKQFQPTKDGARVAMLASSAHKNISKAIDAARYASIESKEAVMISLDKLYPKGDKSVVEKAKTSLERSKQLNKDAKHEMNKTEALKIKIKYHEDKVETIKSTIWNAGYKLNNISMSMAVINAKETMNPVWESIDVMTTVSDEMREQKRRTSDIKSNIQNLRQRLTALEPEWDSKISLAEENISETLNNIRRAKISLNEIETVHHKEHEKFEMWNETMSRQLQELKDKMAKARHAAEGIKISLESLTPKCVRSYIPQTLGLSTSNIIKISIALNNTKGNSPLIFLQGRERKFIALEMFRRKIRFLWNMGGGIVTVTHPTEIETRDPKYDDAWYHIEANRTLNYGSLLVRRMTNSGILNDSYAVTGNSHPEYTRFIRTKSDRIWLGGVPKELTYKDLLASPGLNVIVHQVYVDFKPIGIWNFAHSEGKCGGAISGATETGATSNARHFDGNGYSVMNNTRFRLHRDNVFELQLTFKSMDENSLLFLAVDDQTNRTISVKLKEGKVVFEVQYGDDNKMLITSKEKHNTGRWTKVEAAREFNRNRRAEMGILRIDQKKSIKGFPGIPIESSEIPDVSTASYHIGGVPPGFSLELIDLSGSKHNSFLGCMMDIIINRDSYDPLQGSEYFGIESSCKPTSNKVGFYGNGFIELQSQSLKKKANIAFVFRTLQPDCLLLLSAYPPNSSHKTDNVKEPMGNYSISLVDGRVHLWINTGLSSVKLQSNTTLNDGEYHIINVIKFGRRVELMIDDEFHKSEIFSATPTIVNMPKESGGLYIGGAPDFIEYKGLSPTLFGLQGSLKDLVFNNKTIILGEAISFKNAQIGRTGPEMGSSNTMNDVLMKTEPIEKMLGFIPSTEESCVTVDNFSYEENAYKYGDAQLSYSQLFISTKHFWQKNFQITFYLRTFYPNGVLLLSPGSKEKQKHYVSLLLKDGHLNLIVRGRRKEEIPLTAKLNNGEWHKVTVNCLDRKITMSVEIGGTDQKTSVQMKIPKKISAVNTIFVGGLPEKPVGLPSELLVKIEGFKGCIRNLEINNNTQDLTKDKKHMNVGKCFRNVEKGSHFIGNAYAVYKKNFHVGKYLEFELDFRTSEMNGILMSVSEPDGFPAISLEIYNGNVVLSCDLGDGNPFRVETYLPSKYSICDNKWHNVSALYDFEQIALRIDNQPPTVSVAQHRVSGKVQTKSPLYIGGLPDHAPSGTLLSRGSFKGCIRNIAIRNERKDWIDMDSLHNIQLSECLSL
ncbi:laminin subunit alpha-1 [Condylostylus longicornis]|uniref:laminin subunit alpha-1 n=1 Tax=Condylostylus longicornis TaxID=2530218 RepID=UPI00244E0935|nr:laminin subunit alpha-1 [Condylostylus longicornis]